MRSLLILFVTGFVAQASLADIGDTRDQVETKLKLSRDFKAQDMDPYDNSYVYQLDLNKKCSLMIESIDVINLKSQEVLLGLSLVKDRVTYGDADAVGKSITSQIVFENPEKKITVVAACFDQGILFRSVPSLEQLIKLLEQNKLMQFSFKN